MCLRQWLAGCCADNAGVLAAVAPPSEEQEQDQREQQQEHGRTGEKHRAEALDKAAAQMKKKSARAFGCRVQGSGRSTHVLVTDEDDLPGQLIFVVAGGNRTFGRGIRLSSGLAPVPLLALALRGPVHVLPPGARARDHSLARVPEAVAAVAIDDYPLAGLAADRRVACLGWIGGRVHERYVPAVEMVRLSKGPLAVCQLELVRQPRRHLLDALIDAIHVLDRRPRDEEAHGRLPHVPVTPLAPAAPRVRLHGAWAHGHLREAAREEDAPEEQPRQRPPMPCPLHSRAAGTHGQPTRP